MPIPDLISVMMFRCSVRLEIMTESFVLSPRVVHGISSSWYKQNLLSSGGCVGSGDSSSIFAGQMTGCCAWRRRELDCLRKNKQWRIEDFAADDIGRRAAVYYGQPTSESLIRDHRTTLWSFLTFVDDIENNGNGLSRQRPKNATLLYEYHICAIKIN